MSAIKSKVFVDKLIDVAKNRKTLYVMGCFGAPLNSTNKNRYINNGAHGKYNAQVSRKAMINAASSDTFGFDCVCLIKGILWGWSGNASKIYGGATYTSNDVPDISADQMIKVCSGVSTTGWDNMVPGEAVWCSGHIGVYIGGGLAVECTPRWSNNVQITAVGNIGNKAGYNARVWTKHGKLPYVDYSDQNSVTTAPNTSIITTPSGTTTNTATDLKVGTIVSFIGTKHYSYANASSGLVCKPGKAKITQIYSKGKHPYHLVAISGGGSNVYGWVDVTDIIEAVSVSNENAIPRNVRITATALNVRTGPGTTYKVVQCIRDRGVYQIVEEKNGWGRLDTGGWISLQYTKNI